MHRSLLSRRPFSSAISRSRPVPMSFIRTFERPSAWKEASPAFPQGSQLQKSQASLPKLPVPELTESLERLRESLKPVAWSDEEFSAASRKIEEFAKGLGPELHKRLAERAGSTPHWLEEWWDDAGYLTYRDPVSQNRSLFSRVLLTFRSGYNLCHLLLWVACSHAWAPAFVDAEPL